MSKQLFGTDGIRGIPGRHPLDDETLERVGAALGAYLASHGPERRVLVGMDTRESGPHIAAVIAKGLAVGGARPVFAGVLTTPGVACVVRQQGFAAGVVISASHNPYHDNGVKLIASTGMKFPDAVEAELERSMAAIRLLAKGRLPELAVEAGFIAGYLEALRATLPAGASLAGMKMVLDCANGAASRLAPELFRSLGAEVVAIHDHPDGRNINAECGSQHTEGMQRKVVETRAALGVAFDGDADRAVFSSAAGKRVDGDGILLAAARYLRSVGQLKGTTIVGTTMANLGLERRLAAEGLKLTRVQVGDRYVLEEMLRIGANLGGEQSGHIVFLDDATTGDGMLTAVKLAGIVALRGTLEELVRDLKIYPQTIQNIRVPRKPPLEMLPAVQAALREAEQALGDRGRVVLRYSGTEPLARVMVEAESEAEVRRWATRLVDVVKASISA